MDIPIMDGIIAKTITSERIRTRVLFGGPEDGIPVLFLHGNVSSATWWEETLLALPAGYRGIAPDQRGFGNADPAAKIDATRGMNDLAEDAFTLLDHLGYTQAHVVGNSLGGMVIWRMLMQNPARLLSVTLADPGSPYGFGATRNAEGTPTTPDFAGSGGGLTNPELVRRILDRDMSTESPFSPRAALRMLLVKPPFIAPREDELVQSMLATHIGEQDVPGDAVQSSNWPHMAPGIWGATNATSPKYAGEIKKIIECNPKPPILWVRGRHDLVVSDTAASDPGFLGRTGLLPGWPGEEAYPPQPMLAQTRSLLEEYAAAGGSYQEIVIEDAGHVPFIEKPDAFNAAFHPHIQ
ncbi:MAG: alpha/beta hydrolase [Chloroflexi bacterium]|jgi:pimeloyl-ACP methyl ester carboxylesterase|nr:alpha/beta hydrolase [Chloroflexota bacterium]